MASSSLSAAMPARSMTIGVVAGLRSQLPLALLTHAMEGQPPGFASSSMPAFLRSPLTRRIATVAAIGELIGDKLPMTPSRLAPGPLLGRLLFGGLAGAMIADQTHDALAAGALLGVTGALLGAFAGYHLRSSLGQVTPLPDPMIAVLEDVVAVSAGLRAVSP